MVTARPMTDGSAMTSDEWCTPKWLAEALGNFDMDPCSNARSHIRALRYCSLDHDNPQLRDGLALDWAPDAGFAMSVFVNPPYSNVMPWAVKLSLYPGPWCALLKLDPTTRWWSTLMSAQPSIAMFRKRIKFEGDKAMTANFPSVLVYKRWAPSDELAAHLWMQGWR